MLVVDVKKRVTSVCGKTSGQIAFRLVGGFEVAIAVSVVANNSVGQPTAWQFTSLGQNIVAPPFPLCPAKFGGTGPRSVCSRVKGGIVGEQRGASGKV